MYGAPYRCGARHLLIGRALRDQAEKLPSQLSGGQQQRVALARALAPDPEVLLLDEPLAALDAKVREDLRLEIRALQQRLGITTIMVTHDQEEALTMADRIVVMNAGRIEQVGTAQELYHAPTSRFVAEFIGRMNVIPVEGSADALRFAGRPIELPAKEREGTPAVLGLRPEDVLVRHGDEFVGQSNLLKARVRQSLFLGNITQLLLEVSDNAPPLLAEVHAAHAFALQNGATLQVELPPHALKVLEWR